MFVYRLPSWSIFSRPLLTRIEVCGPFVTVYGRKTVADELDGVIDELKGEVIHAYDLEHGTVHGTSESRFSQEEHFHYKLATKSIPKGLAKLITAIFARQHSPTLRQEDHRRYLAKIEECRKRKGDEEVPDFIKKHIKQIDTSSPFFPSSDCYRLVQDVLSKYASYCKELSMERCRELLSIYIIGAYQPLKPIFYGSISDDKKALKEDIDRWIDPLVEIDNRLRQVQEEPGNLAPLAEIQCLISEIDVEAITAQENPNDNFVTEGTSLKERLDYISRYVEKRIEDTRQLQRINIYPWWSVCSVLRRITAYISSFLWSGRPSYR